MTDLVALTEYLVKSITQEPDMVSVKQFDDEEEMVTIQVLVDNTDMGRVIGKNGNVISAIRTIVQVSAYANNLPHVKVNVDSF